jgi:hypothetical protein
MNTVDKLRELLACYEDLAAETIGPRTDVQRFAIQLFLDEIADEVADRGFSDLSQLINHVSLFEDQGLATDALTALVPLWSGMKRAEG